MKQYNIYHRKDGRWEGRIPVIHKTETARKYTAFYGNSMEEVAAKMHQFQADNAVSDSALTFSQLYEEWLEANQHRIKESTAANYMMKADKHILPAFGSLPISDIQENDIYGFIQKKQADKLSNRYISDIQVLMKSVFRFGAIRYRLLNFIERKPFCGITSNIKSF